MQFYGPHRKRGLNAVMNVLIEGDSLNTVVVLNCGSSCCEVVGLSLYVVIALTFINPLPLMVSVEVELQSCRL